MSGNGGGPGAAVDAVDMCARSYAYRLSRSGQDECRDPRATERSVGNHVIKSGRQLA
jgi:hypothetical protein